MSFVVGFLTGMATGESIERRKRRRHFREYMKRRGFTIVDQNGQPVAIDSVIDDVLFADNDLSNKKKSGQTLFVAGLAVVVIVAVTGGSAVVVAGVMS
jgi:hypothetical protein